MERIKAVASNTRARSGLCIPGFIFLSSLVSPFILETTPACYYAMALFSKRLTCHGCGHRSPQPVRGSVGKFHCSHCDADTYLDQVCPRKPKQSPFKDTNMRNLYRMEKLQTLQLLRQIQQVPGVRVPTQPIQ